MKPIIFNNPYLGKYVNSYLLQNDEFNVFVDTGLFRQNRMLMRDYLEDGRKNVVLSTHGHWDHIGMHADIQKRGGVLYAHAGDERFYRDFDWHWRVLFGQFANDYAIPRERWEAVHYDIGAPLTPDVSIKDGDTLVFGDIRITVVGLPGHSNGSVCFLETTSGMLFTGDGLMGDGFFGGVPQYCDFDAYLASMESIAKLEAEAVYTDHSEPLRGADLASTARAGMAGAERIEALVREHVGKCRGGISVGNVARAVCDSERKAMGCGVCTTALSHLRRMRESEDRVHECLEGYICGI